jgi:hypothetical protein
MARDFQSQENIWERLQGDRAAILVPCHIDAKVDVDSRRDFIDAGEFP